MTENILAVTGTGIKSISQLTVENIAAIEQADVVFYLVNEPVLDEWIKTKSRQCHSLNTLYFSNEKRSKSYEVIADFIIEKTISIKNICFAVYGHPNLLSDTVSHLIKKIDRNKTKLVFLPGISSFDCLLSDLEIDPAQGIFCIEAALFLSSERTVNLDCHLVIWQVGLINDSYTTTTHKNKNHNLNLLKNQLLKYFDANHECILYEASLYPHIPSKILKCVLSELEKQEVSRITTLYISPK